MGKKFEDILTEGNFDSEAKTLIQEAWQAKLSEARDEIAGELREEFSQRFEHDKGVLVESMDSFLTTQIKQEIAELAEDKNKLIAERVQYKKKAKEAANMLERFVVETLTKEVGELREDKKAMQAKFGKLENFVLEQLAGEIRDFHEDKKALAEQRVKLVREGKAELHEAKSKFIKRAAKLVESTVDKSLRQELSTLKQDIVEAKNNDFGRKIFEAFQSEFTTSHLNEGTMVAKLSKKLSEQKKINESLQASVTEKAKLVESAQTKLKVSQELSQRKEIMSEMLQPLTRDQRSVISELLESVDTKNLRSAFNKYLPAVLNETVAPKKASSKQKLSESAHRVEKTGNKGTAQLNESDNESVIDLANIKKLAGI